MLLTKEIQIRTDVGNNKLSYYESIGYDISMNIINVKIEHLSIGSNYIVDVSCDYCDNIVRLTYKAYNKTQLILNKYACSRKCSSIKTKEINIIKYGVESTSLLDSVKEKNIKTNLERYGVDNPSKSKLVKEKTITTNLERYGVGNVFKLKKVQDKRINTMIERYGIGYALQNSLFKQKNIKTNLERYGVDNPSKSKLVKEKTITTNLERYGVDNPMKDLNIRNSFIIVNDNCYIKYIGNEISLFRCINEHNFEISSHNYHTRKVHNVPLCTICNPIGEQSSIKEKELLEYIKSIYFSKVVSGYRDGLEIDIYLPILKIGFEFNGLYYHSSKFKENNYHLNKTNYFKEKGIRIIHIWEDDWILRKDIVKSQIENLLKINSEKIFARKCYVKEIKNSKIISKFLNNNHIQGKVNSSLKLGLYHTVTQGNGVTNEELVSLMTFDHNEGRKKMEEGGWNLNRFCNKLNTNIIGGASKLLSHFIKNYDVKRIVSYADKDWSVGNLYEVLGFINVGGNGPDYKYIVNGCRVHKSRYTKSKLKTELTESKQMEKNGFLKIYDCGKLKFEKKINI